MLTRKWTIWALLFLAIAAVGGGLCALLWFQGLTTAANAVSIITTLAAGAWTLRGLYVWRETPWVRRVNSFVIVVFAFGIVYLILNAAGASTLARTSLYLFGTVAGFMLGINLLRLILQPGWPLLGVARAMIEEAIRMRVALIFIFAVLVLLPALPLMQERGKGQIGIVSSLAGFRGFPGAPAYCGSKAAVKVFGEGLRPTAARSGIEVSVICPGYVRSPMTDVNDFPMPFLMDADKAAKIIRRGLERNKARIAFPWPMHAMVILLQALPPSWIDGIMGRLPTKSG